MISNAKHGAETVARFVRETGERASRLEWKVLSLTPEARMVVQYTFLHARCTSDVQPFRKLIGKFYVDTTGERIYRVMRMIRKRLTKSSALHLTIPEPLFYDPRYRLIVQQHVPGIPYENLIQRPDADLYFTLAGRALAELHTQKLPMGQKKGLLEHFEELIHPHPMAFVEHMPQYRPLVETLLQTLLAREREWKTAQPVTPLHRDVHLRQLFYGKERVWLVDWDLFAKGDPGLDVGNFLVYLRTHLAQRCDASITAFLEGYCSVAPASILQRVPLYEAFTYLRLACKTFRLRRDNWEEIVTDMLSRSEACLDKEID